MILYYTSTGNSRHAAEKIAEAIGDRAYSVTDPDIRSAVKGGDNVLGIVCPTHFLGLPVEVEKFMKETDLDVGGSAYVFFVSTYGGNSGASGSFMEKALGKKGIALDAAFGVAMSDNTDSKKESVIEKNRKVMAEAETAIDDIIVRIRNSENGNYISKKTPVFIAKIVHGICTLFKRP